MFLRETMIIFVYRFLIGELHMRPPCLESTTFTLHPIIMEGGPVICIYIYTIEIFARCEGASKGPSPNANMFV